MGKSRLNLDRLEMLEKNILNFIKLRKNKQLPLVRTSFVALKENIHEIDMFINKWKPIVDYVDVQKNVVPYFKFDEMKQLEKKQRMMKVKNILVMNLGVKFQFLLMEQ